MRLRQLLFFPVAVFLFGCAADDGFRPRLAQGCRSEMECAQLATLADARAASCGDTNDPNVVLRVHLDLRPSAPPCDEVEADRRVAHDYLERFVQERERHAAWAAQQEAIRRGDEQARWNAEQEQERRRAADETERRRAADEAERRQRDATAQADIQRMDAQYQAERAAREEAEREAASAPRSSSTLPTTPAPRDTGGHVCCCDGTLSPTCTTVHRGCCSHHGGVCACE